MATFCHDHCERYREWAENRRTELALRDVAREADEVQITSIYKVKRRRRDRT